MLWLRLLLDPGQTITAPLKVVLGGADQRGVALAQQQFWWDPRPWLVVVSPGPQGDQLELLGRDGHWRLLSEANGPITSVEPLGNGAGIAFSTSGGRTEETWLLELDQQATFASKPQSLVVKGIKRLLESPLTFSHFSSNRKGDLLIQWGAPGFARSFTSLIQANGQRRRLDLDASGTAQLLPGGGALIAPEEAKLPITKQERAQGKPTTLMAQSRPASHQPRPMTNPPKTNQSRLNRKRNTARRSS